MVPLSEALSILSLLPYFATQVIKADSMMEQSRRAYQHLPLTKINK